MLAPECCPPRRALICQPCGKGIPFTFQAFSVVVNGPPGVAKMEIMNYPMPTPTGNQVLIKTKYAGICHSELHFIEGYFDMGGGNKAPLKKATRDDPYTLGHEFEGLIVAAGDDVPLDTFDMNKSYAVFPWIGCDLPEDCVQCSVGNSNLCPSPKTQRFIDGKSIYGGYASHILVPHYKYLMDYTGALPEGLGCVYMCSGLTAFSALEAAFASRNPPRSGEDLVILGCGGLGFQGLTMAMAKYGAPIACDIAEAKLEEAAKLGCKTFNSAKEESIKRIHALSKGGVAAVIDFVGSEKSYAFASKLIRSGGKVIIVGLMGGQMASALPMFAFRQIAIEGSMVGNQRQASDMLELLRTAKIPVVPHHFRSVYEVNEGLKDLADGKYLGRCILKHDWSGPESSKI